MPVSPGYGTVTFLWHVLRLIVNNAGGVICYVRDTAVVETSVAPE
jgi:hypothetical protein